GPHPRDPDHHADRTWRGERPRRRAGGRSRRLRGQAVLRPRAAGPDPRGDAALARGRRARQRAGRRPAHRWRRAPGAGQRQPGRASGPDRADRIPAAALLHDPPQPRLRTQPAARPRVGRQCLRRGAHRGRPHPAAAQDPGAVRPGGHGPDRSRRRLPLLRAGGLNDKMVGWYWLRLAAVLAVAIGVAAWQARNARRLRERVAVMEQAHEDQRTRMRRLLAMLRAYRAAADTLPEAIVAVERNSQRVLWFNAAATPLLGLNYPQDIDASISDRLQPLPMSRWMSMGRHAGPMVDVASPADPSLRLQLRLLPYSEDLWLLVARDVTKLVRLEHMRRDFVANVSHELRTPLTVIHGYLDIIDPEDHPALAPMLGEMSRQSERMTRLVEDLLTLSRLEAREQLDEEPVPMAAMLATLRREAEALSQGRHHITVHDEAGI